MDDLEQVARRICVRHKMQFVKAEGQGAFKQTFRVIDPHGTHIALKLYKAASGSGRDNREIRAMSRCKHDNIARLFSLEPYSHKGQEYLALLEEYLPGGTLASKGQLSVSQCLAVGEQLIDALAHLSQLNLVHRDIKPENIMFRADGKTPVLTDFGVVRDLNDSSVTPTWAPRGPGTPFFSAPEQLNNEKSLIDWRTDQFALGVVIAQAIFRDHPFRTTGASDSDVVNRVLARQQAAGWFIKHATDNGMTALIKMVSPWPVDRFLRPSQLKLAWRNQKG